jgi:hypothetical protein
MWQAMPTLPGYLAEIQNLSNYSVKRMVKENIFLE